MLQSVPVLNQTVSRRSSATTARRAWPGPRPRWVTIAAESGAEAVAGLDLLDSSATIEAIAQAAGAVRTGQSGERVAYGAFLPSASFIAFGTGGAWIFYFHDAPTLIRTFWIGQAPATAYVSCIVLTGTTYVFAGWMREQVCTYMCPWPRIQGAMLDEESLIVTYNAWRGEPRMAGRKKAEAERQAHGGH